MTARDGQSIPATSPGSVPPREVVARPPGVLRALTARNALIAHLLTLLATLLVLLYYGSHQWFFADEWEFITRNLPGQGRLGLFVPHNEHWSTIPILVYRGLFALVGLHTYLPYVIVLILLHLTAAHLIWRLALRAGATPWIATAVGAVFLMLGVGYEQLIDAFQMSFSLSLCCGLGWLLLNDHDLPAPGRLAAGWALGVAASMSSGIGIPMIGVVAIAALARRGIRDAVAVASVPALANVIWYAAVHPHATLPSTRHQLLMLPDFIWRGLTATADGAIGVPVVGAVLLIGLAVWLGARNRDVPAIVWGGASGAVLLFVVVGYGRISLGVDQAAAPRYLYLSAALLSCPAAAALTALAQRRLLLEAVAVATLALSTLHGAYVLRINIRDQLPIRVADRAVVMAAARATTSGAPLFGTQPDPVYGPDIDVADLRTLVQSGALPVTGRVDPVSLLTVESRIELAGGPVPRVAGPPPVLRMVDGSAAPASGGCTSVTAAGSTAEVKVSFSAPSSFSVSTAASQPVDVVLSSSSTQTNTAPPVDLLSTPAAPLWISVSAPGATVAFTLSSPAVICGVAAP